MRNLIFYFLIICTAASCQKNKVDSKSEEKEPDCITQQSEQNGDPVAGRYIVAYGQNTSTERNNSKNTLSFDAAILQRHHISTSSLLGSFDGENAGFIANLSSNELASLQEDDNISMIEPDRIIALSECFTIVAPSLITWNINRVGYGDGTGKLAWIIDSGIDFDHPDLTVDRTRSKSFISGQNSAEDENGHGTHVAGIIGANNNTIGVLGVAPGATLISLRVLDKDGRGLLSAIIQALAYVSTNGHAGDAVNLSLGEDGVSDILDQQVRNTASKGIYIAIAAGNDHKPANQSSPARVNGANIYTVSAIDSTGKFASFSNYGNDVVDFAAPGVRIRSTYLNNQYAIMSGTSMAAPHMTGLLLLNGNNIQVSGTASADPDGDADPIAHH